MSLINKAVNSLRLGALLALMAGCSERTRVANSDYSVVHPESRNPDGHPGIFLYYKGKPVWFNVGCPDFGFHDGILVFEGDVPESPFNGKSSGLDVTVSWQVFAIRGSGPPVMISEQILKQPIKPYSFDMKISGPTTNGLTVSFSLNDSSKTSTNVMVTWPEIKMWLDEAETNAPIKNSRMGKYRYLTLKQS